MFFVIYVFYILLEEIIVNFDIIRWRIIILFYFSVFENNNIFLKIKKFRINVKWDMIIDINWDI